jgi:two-component system chemotaxis response regulator CheB
MKTERAEKAGKTRVVMVDDSALARAVLKQILEQEGDIEVIGEANDGLHAVESVQRWKPDLVTMDIDMPGMGGLDAIQKVMETCPVPVLVVTGERLGPGTDLGFRAIERGALDFVAKPTVLDPDAGAALRASVRILSKVPVFVHASDRPAAQDIAVPTVEPPKPESAIDLVAIAGAAGGPRAIAAILSRLPVDFRCPIAVAQRLPPTFAPAYARYLRSLTQLNVVVIDGPRDCSSGEIILVPGDAHLVCTRKGTFAPSTEPATTASRPSADVLFSSVAEAYGARAIGVILSGTGDDGVKGLAMMRARGALTVAENPKTAMPADMPRAAVEAAVVERAISAELIADFLSVRVRPEAAKSTAPPSFPKR